MTDLEIIKAARQVISDPDHWLRNHYAENADGETCWGYQEDAIKWCSTGAIQKVGGNDTMISGIIAEAAGIISLIEANDHANDHAEIMAVWDRAIAKLEEKNELA